MNIYIQIFLIANRSHEFHIEAFLEEKRLLSISNNLLIPKGLLN